MQNKVHLILALACVLCFSANLSAQDAEQAEKPKAAEKSKKGKKKQPRAAAKLFGGATLTEAQLQQFSTLMSEKKAELSSIKSNLSELISKENAASIKTATRKAMKEGKNRAGALKAAWEEIGLTAEQQEKVSALLEQRREIERGIKEKIVATFSDEQKDALKTRRGKKMRGDKEKKNKGKKKAQEAPAK